MDVIPNNIGLEHRHELWKFVSAYMVKFQSWWDERGPLQFRDVPIYLRCPRGCDKNGWAEFHYVRPSDYRWGLFQTPRRDRQISFGDNRGQAVWQEVPDEHRAWLLEHIQIQADAEPASVEQSRGLVASAPSLYDLRNLYQFLLEESRHLWSMVHLLFEYFGVDGQVEAEALLDRNCGSEFSPRILDAFNLKIEDWLSYFIWCFLADRDGKYQLSCMKHAAFDPLARSSGFILLEEPLHLFIGTHGLERVVARTIELTRQHDTFDIFGYGGIPFATIQRYLNLWAPRVYDLFGNDESKRAKEAFLQGLRARPYEPDCTDHDGLSTRIWVDRRVDTRAELVEVTELEALNASMRQRFIREASFAIGRWNAAIAAAGIDLELRLPSDRFNRRIGPCAGLNFTPAGALALGIAAEHWLPSIEERAAVAELMRPVLDPDSYASWIAPPRLGINGRPTAGFRYVHL